MGDRGHITRNVTFFCGKCDIFDTYREDMYKDEAWNAGWSNSKEFGWICRRCNPRKKALRKRKVRGMEGWTVLSIHEIQAMRKDGRITFDEDGRGHFNAGR